MLVGTIKRKNEGAPTIADMPCPAHNMSLQPHIRIFSDSQAAQFPSPLLKVETLAGHCLVVQGGEDAATQLDAPGNLSRASNLPSNIKPTFPSLNTFYKLDLKVNFGHPSSAPISGLKPSVDLYVFFLFWPTPGPP